MQERFDIFFWAQKRCCMIVNRKFRMFVLLDFCYSRFQMKDIVGALGSTFRTSKMQDYQSKIKNDDTDSLLPLKNEKPEYLLRLKTTIRICIILNTDQRWRYWIFLMLNRDQTRQYRRKNYKSWNRFGPIKARTDDILCLKTDAFRAGNWETTISSKHHFKKIKRLVKQRKWKKKK